MKFAFIQAHDEEFDILRMGQMLGVSRSGYYAWRQRPPSERERANQELAQLIEAAHERSRGAYGSPRVHAELKAQGRRVGHNRVARLMRLHGLQGRRRRCFKVTTQSKPSHPVAPNVLNQQFDAKRPNEKWLADITYIATHEGWLYLAVVLDVYSRLIVGWAMGIRLEQELVLRAVRMALHQRRPQAKLLHHSDRGSQYTAEKYHKLLAAYGITVSLSGTGNCYDNAMMESFFSTLKAECVTEPYATRAEARRSVFDYIAVWYNRQRRHSALGYVSSEAFEQAAS
ncbi:MAG: IS3 family transposase [Anaerolineae bacterium]